MAKHNEIGKWGENLACDKLTSEGWAIAERNWREGHLELDIVAISADTIVFAEVKTRASMDEDPLEVITIAVNCKYGARSKCLSGYAPRATPVSALRSYLQSTATPRTIASNTFPTPSTRPSKPTDTATSLYLPFRDKFFHIPVSRLLP